METLLWASQDDRGMIRTWRVISLRLFLFRATQVSYHRNLARQSDRSLPLLFKVAPVSCLASAWSISCFVAPEPGSTWVRKSRTFPIPLQLSQLGVQAL